MPGTITDLTAKATGRGLRAWAQDMLLGALCSALVSVAEEDKIRGRHDPATGREDLRKGRPAREIH